jgi:signal transduction histidine kinase
MRQSHDLIEEQFNNKARMALCSAVESLGDNSTIEVQATCAKVEGVTEDNLNRLDDVLKRSLAFYDIDIPYEIQIIEADEKSTTFSCSLIPLADNSQQAQIFFPGKDRYIYGKMGFMLTLSIFILLFVVGVVLAANHAMLRQKRISEINVDFFNNMAHEFRTPLTSIKLAANLFAKKQPQLTENKYLSVINRESNHLLRQTERVLHLAKMEGSQYQLQKEEIALDELITTIVTEMEMIIRDKNAEVNFHKTGTNWTVEGDKYHLGNAFRNLLDNALKYSENQPVINIQLKQDENGVRVIFEDNGIGISKQNQQLIFDKYHRVKTGNRHDYKGFGLGLAYVKMIIERHKGIVNIVSELKKGSRFDLFIPTTV